MRFHLFRLLTPTEVKLMEIGQNELERQLKEAEAEKKSAIRDARKDIDDLIDMFADSLLHAGYVASLHMFKIMKRLAERAESIAQSQLDQLRALDTLYEGRNDDVQEAIEIVENKIKEIDNILKNIIKTIEKFETEGAEQLKESKRFFKEVMYNVFEAIFKTTILEDIDELIRKESKKIGIELKDLG